MQNTGGTTWTPDAAYRLGSQNPQDNTTWGLSRVPLTSSVAPGSTATFAFNITAPAAPGTYNFQWRVVDSAIGWFGDTTTNVAVQDGVNNAQFVSQNVPTSMNPGQTYPVSVTLQNTGNTTWTAANGYQLGSQNPQANTNWGLSRVDLPGPVSPGANVTISFNVTAPTTSGPYNFQWQMVHGASERFGASTANVSVLVNSSADDMYFVQVDHLNTTRLIQDQAGNTVWRWDQGEPFGNSVPNGDPNNSGNNFEFNPRFPGQFFDRETGLAYNVNRDYWPEGGRYIQPDPIGIFGTLRRPIRAWTTNDDLALVARRAIRFLTDPFALITNEQQPVVQGSLNLYGYGEFDPLSFIDPFGLEPLSKDRNRPDGRPGRDRPGGGIDASPSNPGGIGVVPYRRIAECNACKENAMKWCLIGGGACIAVACGLATVTIVGGAVCAVGAAGAVGGACWTMSVLHCSSQCDAMERALR